MSAASIDEARAQHAFCAGRAKISALHAKMARDPDSRARWLDSQREWEAMAAYWATEVRCLQRVAE